MELFALLALVMLFISLFIARGLQIRQEDHAKLLISFLFIYSILVTIIFMFDAGVVTHEQYIVHVSCIWAYTSVVASVTSWQQDIEPLVFFTWLLAVFTATLAT